MNLVKRVHDAIKKIYPDANFKFEEKENLIDGLTWDDTRYPKPTLDMIEANMISEIELLRNNKISEVKIEASRRIVLAYPEWKQRNHMAAVVDIQNKELIALKTNTTYTLSADELAIVAAAQAAKNEIFNIRAKSDELEASLDTMTQEQLEAFDATNDSNWV